MHFYKASTLTFYYFTDSSNAIQHENLRWRLHRRNAVMITHIHHINFVVSDLPPAVAYFTKLLAQQATIENLPQRNVNTARFKMGESILVLVQPLSKQGVVADILANKGEGIFLLSFATESINDTLLQLELTNSEKRTGLQGWPICDISPLERFGAILQLTENLSHNHSK
jgi:methylmalonyl-CoA/ethylmalonyl-CoA epimerase